MSTKTAIVSAIGPDKIGIVMETTKAITGAGGNVGDSRMSRLSGSFSMLMTVTGTDSSIANMTDTLNKMSGGKDGMEYKVREVVGEEDGKGDEDEFAAFFRLEGADSPGLITKVTSIFSAHALSVDYIETEAASAPFGGTTLFSMDGRVTLSGPMPASFDPDVIREKLDALADEENVDIQIFDQEDLDEIDDGVGLP